MPDDRRNRNRVSADLKIRRISATSLGRSNLSRTDFERVPATNFVDRQPAEI